MPLATTLVLATVAATAHDSIAAAAPEEGAVAGRRRLGRKYRRNRPYRYYRPYRYGYRRCYGCRGSRYPYYSNPYNYYRPYSYYMPYGYYYSNVSASALGLAGPTGYSQTIDTAAILKKLNAGGASADEPADAPAGSGSSDAPGDAAGAGADAAGGSPDEDDMPALEDLTEEDIQQLVADMLADGVPKEQIQQMMMSMADEAGAAMRAAGKSEGEANAKLASLAMAARGAMALGGPQEGDIVYASNAGTSG